VVQSKRDKAAAKGVKRISEFVEMGKQDALSLIEAAEGFGRTRMQMLTEHVGKMDEDQFKSYAKGMRDIRNAQEEGSERANTMRTLISEFKRVWNSYHTKGQEFTNKILTGKGTWREKIKQLPTVTGGGQGKGKKGKRKATAPEGGTVRQFEDVNELLAEIAKGPKQTGKKGEQPIGELSDETVRQVVIYGMTERMIPRLFANTIAKMRMSKDKFWNHMADDLQAAYEARVKADGREEELKATAKQAQRKAA
jgi:hypothetical protein